MSWLKWHRSGEDSRLTSCQPVPQPGGGPLPSRRTVGARKVATSRPEIGRPTETNVISSRWRAKGSPPRRSYGMSMFATTTRGRLLILLLSIVCLICALAGHCHSLSTTSRPALHKPAITRVAGGANVAKTGSTARRLLATSAPQLDPQDGSLASSGKVAVSSRLSPVRVPADSNAILKCLISGPQTDGPIVVVWSRYSSDTNELEELLLPSGSPDWPTGETLNLTSATSGNNIIITGSSSDSRARKRQLPPLVDSTAGGVGSDGGLDEASLDKQRLLRDFLARSRQETRRVSNLILEASLTINPVKPTDNGTYFCTATEGPQSTELGRARIDLVALSKPRVDLVRIQFSRDSKSALVIWLVASDGNTPIKKTILMVRNDTYSASDLNATGGQVIVTNQGGNWRRIDIPDEGHPVDMSSIPASGVPANQLGSNNYYRKRTMDTDVDITSPQESYSNPRLSAPATTSNSRWQAPALARPSSSNGRMRAHNLTGLQPGVTYSFRLAALNDMGQSGWSELVATAPNEVPVQITEIQLLGASNETLAIGWRRPQYDTAKTIRYEMQLFDLNRTLTLDAYTNTSASGPVRNNFMYVFVNLQPGTDYHFQVRACSKVGCSSWSWPRLLASTADGEPDEPTEVELNCDLATGELSVSWLQPLHPRGQLINYTVAVESRAEFWNQTGQLQVEEWGQTVDTPDNQTLGLVIMSASATGALYRQLMLPNTNYSAKVCANNRSSRCGRFSLPTAKSHCSTPPELPREIPAGLRLVPDSTNGALSLELPPMSRRNGSVDCLELALIRLPGTYSPGAPFNDFLPTKPQELMEHIYKLTLQNQNPQLVFVYLAEQVGLNPTQDRLIRLQLGDGSSTTTLSALTSNNNNNNNDSQSTGCGKLAASEAVIQDIKLNPSTYYSGFVRFLMASPPQISYSDYLEPVITGQTVPEPATGPKINLVSGAGGEEDNYNASIMGQQLRELANRMGSTLSAKAMALYQQASSFISDNVSLDSVTDILRKSSPGMQVLEVGLTVIGVSLFLLLVVYLIRMPLGSGRRKRSKKQKLKNHEMAKDELEEKLDSGRKNDAHLDTLAPVDQQQTDVIENCVALPVAGDVHHALPKSQECPIHASPHNHGQPPQSALDIHKNSLARQYMQQQHQQYDDQLHQAMLSDSGGDQQRNTQVMDQYRNCRTMRRQSQKYLVDDKTVTEKRQQQQQLQHHLDYSMTMSQSNSVLAYAKKINKSIPLHLFGAVYECRLKNGWLRDEYEQLPRPQLEPSLLDKPAQPQQRIKLRAQLVVSRDDSISALISGNEYLDASLVRLASPQMQVQQSPAHSTGICERQLICARSPLDADSVWDLWRLVYEQEVSIIVMLGQVEDPHTGETRCAQYWPTSDNEETTILSPCNEYVQGSIVQPAKFKIRQETLEEDTAAEFKVRRLTLMVMATRPEENAPDTGTPQEQAPAPPDEMDEESLVIIERNVIHLQYIHWNSSTPEARNRLIKFVEMAGEQHQRAASGAHLQDSPVTNDEGASPTGYRSPMLVHCYNGLGRSGLFAAMSSVVDLLAQKLAPNRPQIHDQLQAQPKINLFQIVSNLRSQRDMLLSPYRLYELLYQLTASCIPPPNSHSHHHGHALQAPHHQLATSHHHQHHPHNHLQDQLHQQQCLAQHHQHHQLQNSQLVHERQYQQQLHQAHLHNQHHHNHHRQYQVQQ